MRASSQRRSAARALLGVRRPPSAAFISSEPESVTGEVMGDDAMQPRRAGGMAYFWVQMDIGTPPADCHQALAILAHQQPVAGWPPPPSFCPSTSLMLRLKRCSSTYSTGGLSTPGCSMGPPPRTCGSGRARLRADHTTCGAAMRPAGPSSITPTARVGVNRRRCWPAIGATKPAVVTPLRAGVQAARRPNVVAAHTDTARQGLQHTVVVVKGRRPEARAPQAWGNTTSGAGVAQATISLLTCKPHR